MIWTIVGASIAAWLILGYITVRWIDYAEGGVAKEDQAMTVWLSFGLTPIIFLFVLAVNVHDWIGSAKIVRSTLFPVANRKAKDKAQAESYRETAVEFDVLYRQAIRNKDAEEADLFAATANQYRDMADKIG